MTDKKNDLIFINGFPTSKNDIFVDPSYSLKELIKPVYYIYNGENKTKWVCKFYDKKSLALTEKKTLQILEDVDHIPKLLYSHTSDILNFSILSLEPGIDLMETLIKKSIKLSEKKIIIKKVLEILAAVHRRGIMHGDIKPENILYDSVTQDVTLIDFESKTTTQYSSPEYIKDNEKSHKSDAWSVGILTYLLLTLEYPFDNDNEILTKNVSIMYDWCIHTETFITSLLEKNDQKRISCEDALNHEWLK